MIDVVELLKQYHAALNNFDLNKVENMFEPEAIYVSPGLNGELVGRDKIISAMRKYFAEYRDQVSHDTKVEDRGNLCVKANWKLAATSALTGEELLRQGTEIIQFSADGLIQNIEVKDEN